MVPTLGKWKWRGGGTGIQDHPQVWSMSEASLGDRTLPQKPKTYERKKERKCVFMNKNSSKEIGCGGLVSMHSSYVQAQVIVEQVLRETCSFL